MFNDLDLTKKQKAAAVATIAINAILSVAIGGAVIWVAYHFISKWW